MSRYSTRDLARVVIERGITAAISGATIWRWLAHDAIRPWVHRSWIFPRDPAFGPKAGRVLDLYRRIWQGASLGPDDYVVSADEKPSIQARARTHPTLPPGPGTVMRVEHEYVRAGALVYLAAWDVHRATLVGRCEPRNGIVSFDALVAQVMRRAPYAAARRVFWVVDNGSAHRGAPPLLDVHVAVKVMTGKPWSLPGVKPTAICASSGTTIVMVGASGAAPGTAGVDGNDAALVPTALVAVTVQV